MRTDAVSAREELNPEVYEQHTQLARDIADVLKKNIVQAVKTTSSEDEAKETWRKYPRPGWTAGSKFGR